MELLIVNENTPPPADQASAAQAYQRGDVVDVRPDGWGWGRMERDNPRFVIVRLKADAGAIERLLGHEVGGGPLSTLLQRRGFRFDLDALAIPARCGGMRDVGTLSPQDLRGMTKRKQPLRDENVLGG